MTPAEIFSRRSLLALSPYAKSGDLLDPPDGVAIASLDASCNLVLDDSGRAFLFS